MPHTTRARHLAILCVMLPGCTLFERVEPPQSVETPQDMHTLDLATPADMPGLATDMAAADMSTVADMPNMTDMQQSARDMADAADMSQPDTPRWLKVATGATHTCAVRGDGGVWCWGNDGDQQLGAPLGNAPPNGHEPRRVTLPAPAIDVASGVTHTCAVLEPSEALMGVNLWCWGSNERGQLGDNTNFWRREARPVSLDRTFTAVAANDAFTCALDTLGNVWCWGDNSFRQVGGQDTVVLTPRIVSIGTQVAALDTGHRHACARTVDGEVYCWGDNQSRQLGHDMDTSGDRPNKITLPGEVLALSTGARHTCALIRQQEGSALSSVWCWGLTVTNTNNELSAPHLIPTDTNTASALSLGLDATIVLEQTGEPFAHGLNTLGQLGTEESYTSRAAEWVRIEPPEAIQSLDLSWSHTCAILGQLGTERVWCWGENSNGQLGHPPSSGGSHTPLVVPLPQ